MTDQEKADFDFLTKQLSQAALALSSPKTAPLAGACVLQLQSFASEKFPAMITAHVDLIKTQVAALSAQMASLGPQMWAELHKRSLKPLVTTTPPELVWLSTVWAAQLPCGDCKMFLANFLRANPPDFASYFPWTVKLHNAVNAKLNKPQLTEEQARAIWG